MEEVTNSDLHFKKMFGQQAVLIYTHVTNTHEHSTSYQSKNWSYHSKIWIQDSVIVGEKIFQLLRKVT